ncbi:MAG: tRNA (adenosine(37)-N6)-dimethylallyltransferase MiaA, partial [Algiphilus sp.]
VALPGYRCPWPRWIGCSCVASSVTRPPIIVVLGPTASGKSGFALNLCERLGGELISVDSAQVYRGMDIGTAKPNTDERTRVPHHLIDICDPAETYSAARFAEDAPRVIAEVQARGRVPVLCGGTMLYLRALFAGLSELPRADAALRAEIAARAEVLGWPALHAELAALDPATAARLHPNDRTRIQRALEITRLTGEPASARRDGGSRAGEQLGPAAFVCWTPLSRPALHTAIETRFRQMIDAGLLEEVRRLHARGDLHADLPAIRAVGYRQLWSFVEGRLDWDVAVAAAIKATKLLAKRQRTWLAGGLLDALLVHRDSTVFHVMEHTTGTAVQTWCDNWVENSGTLQE